MAWISLAADRSFIDKPMERNVPRKLTSERAPTLWINKTAHNLHVKPKAEDLAIRKHIQNRLQHGRHAAIKQQQRRTTTHRTKSLSVDSPTSAYQPSPSAGDLPDPCRYLNDDSTASPCPSLSRGPTPESSASSSPYPPPTCLSSLIPVSKSDVLEVHESLWLSSMRGPWDPFGSAAIPLTPSKLDLLTHYQHFHTRAAWPRLAGAVNDTSADWPFQIKDAVADPLHLQTLFACGAFAKLCVSTDSTAALSTFLSTKHKAITLLRQHITAQSHDKATVLAIMQMVSLSYHAGYYDEAVAYQRGANTILRSHSTEAYKPHEMVLVTDIWLSIGDMELGPFAPHEFDPGPWQHEGLAEDRFRYCRLPELAPQVLPESSLQDIFGAINELSEVYDWMHVTRNANEKSKVGLWLHLRSTAIKRRLMTYLITARRASKKPTELLRETLVTTVCNAAICYVNFAFAPKGETHSILRAGPLGAYRRILRRVVVEAGLCESSRERHQPLLLWLLFVGIVSERHFQQETSSPQDLLLFESKFTGVVEESGCCSWKDSKSVLQRYLYRPQIMDETLQQLHKPGD